MAEWLRERTWAESPDSNRELFADVRTGPHTSALHPFEEPGESALRTTACPDKRTANHRMSRQAHCERAESTQPHGAPTQCGHSECEQAEKGKRGESRHREKAQAQDAHGQAGPAECGHPHESVSDQESWHGIRMCGKQRRRIRTSAMQTTGLWGTCGARMTGVGRTGARKGGERGQGVRRHGEQACGVRTSGGANVRCAEERRGHCRSPNLPAQTDIRTHDIALVRPNIRTPGAVFRTRGAVVCSGCQLSHRAPPERPQKRSLLSAASSPQTE